MTHSVLCAQPPAQWRRVVLLLLTADKTMRQLYKLSNCCYYCTLKTGTIAIGALNPVLMLVGLVVFGDPGAIVQVLDNSSPDWREGRVMESALAVLDPTTWLLLVAGIIATVIGACLVHGARTGNGRLMMPWIVLTAIGLALNIGSIINAITAANIGDTISRILAWSLGGYLLLVVRNYREEVEGPTDVEGGGQGHKTEI